MKDIRKLRRERDWTQVYLASLVGVTGETIRNWEKDPSKIPLRRADQLAKLFGMTLSELCK